MKQKIYLVTHCITAGAFKCKQLGKKGITVVYNNNRPVIVNGNNSLIIKLAGRDGESYAAKIILTATPGIKKRYQHIQQQCYERNPQLMAFIRLYDNELELAAPTNNNIYSIVLMPWLEGPMLLEYLEEKNHPRAIEKQAEKANEKQYSLYARPHAGKRQVKKILVAGMITSVVLILCWVGRSAYSSIAIAKQDKKDTPGYIAESISKPKLPAALFSKRDSTIDAIKKEIITPDSTTEEAAKVTPVKIAQPIKSVNSSAGYSVKINTINNSNTGSGELASNNPIVKRNKHTKSLFRKLED